MQSVFNMVDLQLKSEPILQNHVPWQPSDSVYNGLKPWEPVLGCDNHNIHTDCNPLSSDLFSSQPPDPDVTIIDPSPTETSQALPASPRLDSAQPFTTDPKAVLHCAPSSLPISMPLRYMDKPSTTAAAAATTESIATNSSAGDSRPSTPQPGGPPQGPYFFIPSPPQGKQRTPSPPLSSLPWDQWLRSPTPSPPRGKMSPRTLSRKTPSPRSVKSGSAKSSPAKSSPAKSRSSAKLGESPGRVTKRKGKKREEEDPAYSPRRSTKGK